MSTLGRALASGRWTAPVGICVLALAPGPARGQATEDGARPPVEVQTGSLDDVRLQVGAWIQTRWEHVDGGAAEPVTGFSITRARLDLQGEALGGRVGFRLQPELAGDPSLRDAYIEVALWSGVSVRAGQYPVPFQWRVSPKREQLPEGGITQGEFGTPTGREVGVVLEARAADDRSYYAFGLYSGEGRNRRLPATPGYLVAARVGRALLGTIPRDESDWSRTPHTRISVGVGLEAADRNRGRSWGKAVGLPEVEADWATAMADVQLQRRGLALNAEAYGRRVAPRTPAVPNNRGWGLGASVGWVLPTGLPLEGVVRVQKLQVDTNRPETGVESVDVGLNLYVRGHALKLRTYASRIWSEAGRTDGFVTDLNLLVG